MSKKNVFVAVVLTVCVIAAAGTLLASNMGFKLNYGLNATQGGVSASGNNTLALPYFRQTGLNDSLQLMSDIGSGSIVPVNSVSRFNKINNGFTVYTGRMGSPSGVTFALVAGDGYFVNMGATLNYIIVGAHDPALNYTLNATQGGVSASGNNLYAPPYNITSTNSLQLMTDIGGGSIVPVNSVSRFLKLTNGYTVYTGRMGSPSGLSFVLSPGEAYLVNMASTVPYIASHY